MSNLAVTVPTTFPEVRVPIPMMDPRHAARAALREYLLSLTYLRPSGDPTKPPIEFRVLPKDLFTEWPDPEKKMNFPSIAILGGTGVHEEINLTPTVVDESYNVYAPSTALVQLAEFVETFQVSVFAADRVERRSMVAQLISSMSPTEEMYGLRLRTRDYFDRVATYLLLREEYVEDEAVRNLRRADLFIEARIAVVKLMPFRPIQPQVAVDVSEGVPQFEAGVSIVVEAGESVPAKGR